MEDTIDQDNRDLSRIITNGTKTIWVRVILTPRVANTTTAKENSNARSK